MNFHAIKLLVSAAILTAAGSVSTPAYAKQSSAECNIWLCLPAGFPANANCESALVALKKRIKKGMPAVPSYQQCNLPSTQFPQALAGHTVGYDPCTSGYTPAAANESISDVGQRAPVNLSPWTSTSSGSTFTANGGVNTCLNLVSGSRYTPRSHHTITLRFGTPPGSNAYPYTVHINGNRPPRRGSGAGNVR